jgi:hypothetical protein
MNDRLDYRDLIDLEYLFSLDKHTGSQEKHRRDRQLYFDLQNGLGKNFSDEPAALLKGWVDRRRAALFSSPTTKSPGAIVADVNLLSTVLLGVKGVLAGLLAGLLFFSYSGTTPVNVFHFLLLFIFPQLFLTALLLATVSIRSFLPGVKVPSFYSFLFRSLAGRVIGFLSRRLQSGLNKQERLNLRAALGVVQVNSRVYGSLSYWPLFLLAQLFGIAFNAGLLAATLVKIAASDLAFGWQSTIQVSSAAVHRLTEMLALPWLYFVPGHLAVPSLEEIEGSRIILKEGIYHLSTRDLVAWWPFLVFCLLFYGLILRFCFYGFGKLMERRSLRNFRLDTADSLGLLRRMRTPVVSSQAAPESGAAVPVAGTGEERLPSAGVVEAGRPVGVLVLVPDEIFSLCGSDILKPLLQERGLIVDSTIRFMEDYESDQQLLSWLAGISWNEHLQLLLVVEGWMVPLVGFMTYLGQLRESLPQKTLIHLALVGCPEEAQLAPIKQDDLKLWQKNLIGLGDPYLSIFPLLSTKKK